MKNNDSNTAIVQASSKNNIEDTDFLNVKKGKNCVEKNTASIVLSKESFTRLDGGIESKCEKVSFSANWPGMLLIFAIAFAISVIIIVALIHYPGFIHAIL